MDTIVCHDLHLRHTDIQGRTRVERYRVWDAVRKVDACEQEASKANADFVAAAASRGDVVRGYAGVVMISEATYKRERAARR